MLRKTNEKLQFLYQKMSILDVLQYCKSRVVGPKKVKNMMTLYLNGPLPLHKAKWVQLNGKTLQVLNNSLITGGPETAIPKYRGRWRPRIRWNCRGTPNHQRPPRNFTLQINGQSHEIHIPDGFQSRSRAFSFNSWWSQLIHFWSQDRRMHSDS